MLLLMIGGTNAPNRIFEAVIGGVVALAVAVIFPPKAILHVGRAGQSVMAALGQSLERIAAALAAGDADRAETALTQARAIDALLDALDDALETGRETVRTAPTRFGEREPVERYGRSFEQIDLAVAQHPRARPPRPPRAALRPGARRRRRRGHRPRPRRAGPRRRLRRAEPCGGRPRARRARRGRSARPTRWARASARRPWT